MILQIVDLKWRSSVWRLSDFFEMNPRNVYRIVKGIWYLNSVYYKKVFSSYRHWHFTVFNNEVISHCFTGDCYSILCYHCKNNWSYLHYWFILRLTGAGDGNCNTLLMIPFKIRQYFLPIFTTVIKKYQFLEDYWCIENYS